MKFLDISQTKTFDHVYFQLKNPQQIQLPKIALKTHF
jgi:hypothetical protein